MHWLLAGLVLGSAVFCGLVIVAALRHSKKPSPATTPRPISILKPLAGAEADLETNLRSFFTQNYPAYEILFAVRSTDDPATPIVERLRQEFAQIPTRLIVTGEPPYANAKVWSLEQMTAAARHDLLAMSDSDIRVDEDFLRTIAAEFERPGLDVATCPYRAVPGASLWSRLEALMMNTEFLSGILVARMMEGMRFAVGPTIVARKSAIEAIGGWPRVKDYLAEDFMLGQLAAAKSLGVDLSTYVIEHHIGSQAFAANAAHRLRWCRSTRRSRPLGYLGQVFTNPTPLALALWIAAPAMMPLAVAALVLRMTAAWCVAGGLLRDPLSARYWYLIPVSDLVSFAFWIAGFFGNTIQWRGRTYYLHRDGTFERTT